MPTNLAALIARIPRVVDDDSGIGSAESRLASEIQRYAGRAIPFLLPLLKHPSPGVRNLTEYTLRDIKGLNESHLAALIAAERREMGWLPPAIARIGTPRAVAFLAEDLKRAEGVDNQVGSAFELLGIKGVPALCQLLQSASAKDGSLFKSVRILFGRLDIRARTFAVEPLLRIASDKHLLAGRRQYALLCLGELGQPALRCIPIMERLAQTEPVVFRDAVESALFSMGAPGAVPGLLKQLRRKDATDFETLMTIRNIASLETNGVSAGPTIVEFFSQADWDIRVAAARTAGFIGYREAVPSLTKLVTNREDWRLAWVSAESLGKLGATESLSTLQKVAIEHWFPPVRKSANAAIARLRRPDSYSAPTRTDATSRFGSAFFTYNDSGREDTFRMASKGKAAADPHIVIPEGTFSGSDRGEWGGDLTFVTRDGTKQTVLTENIQALARLGEEIVAASGLAHMGMNSGYLYRVVRGPTGKWVAEKWRALPGAPVWAESRVVNGLSSLRVACVGGTVDVLSDGTMRFVP